MKDMVTPVPPEEVKGVIRKCLEQAAQLNYQRIKDYAKIEGNQTSSLNDDEPVKARLGNVAVENVAISIVAVRAVKQKLLLPPDFLLSAAHQYETVLAISLYLHMVTSLGMWCVCVRIPTDLEPSQILVTAALCLSVK